MKQVFYKEEVYNVEDINFKSIDKTDVAKLKNDLIVFWDKKTKNWKECGDDLKNKFMDVTPGRIKLNGSDTLIDVKIDNDTLLSLKDSTYAKIKIEKIVKRQDKKSDIWEEVDENDESYQIYNMIINK